MNNKSALILFLFVAAGFGFLVAELNILGHTAGPRQIGFFAAIAGAVLALVSAFVASPMVRRILGVLFVLLAVTGLLGVNAHEGGRVRRAGVIAALPAPPTGGLAQAAGTFQRLPPTLAPLMLSGLSLLGATLVVLSAGLPGRKAA